jgi:hypothetical protein
MSSETLLSLAPLLFTASALMLTLWLFFQLKTEIARLGISSRESETEKSLQLFQARLDKFAARIEERNALEPSPLHAGLNLGKRTHVLRLSRRGDAPDHIAATLCLPRREVELLLKIHDLSIQTAPGAKVETVH